MRHTLSVSTCLVSALLLAGCATAPAPAPEAAAPTYLDEATYRPLVNGAYELDTYEERETAFDALLARGDLTQDQVAETYLMRGLIRGIYVNDGPFASPYCAVEDFAKFDALASPDHPRREQMADAHAYQTSRYQYFEEPESCE